MREMVVAYTKCNILTISICRRLLHPSNQVHSSRTIMKALKTTLIVNRALQYTMPWVCSPGNAYNCLQARCTCTICSTLRSA